MYREVREHRDGIHESQSTVFSPTCQQVKIAVVNFQPDILRIQGCPYGDSSVIRERVVLVRAEKKKRRLSCRGYVSIPHRVFLPCRKQDNYIGVLIFMCQELVSDWEAEFSFHR